MAVQPSQLGRYAEQRVAAASDSYDGYDTKAAEQLREDQCAAADALRKGGPKMFALAQDAIGLPPDQLHEKLKRDLYDNKTPLHQAHAADSASSDQWVKKVNDQEHAFSTAVSGLSFYPDAPQGEDKIYDQTGLLPWLWQSYFKSVDLLLPAPFYDPSPTADDKTKAAALTIGDQLYATGGTPEEQQAWALWKKNSGKIEPNNLFVPRVFADDARIFLSSGGFPRTAPAQDTPEFRVAVEDLKARFASCAWHDPIDPNRVLGKEVAQASAEWQREIASQATQRQQILGASATATKALQDGTFILGQVLGQSWLADYATRWQDYWSAGGLGWIGDSYVTIEVPGAKGNCLDVAGGGKTNGTPVQIYTCNNGASQQWTLEGSEDDLYLRNVGSQKCLDVAGNASANGTKIQISDCYKSKGQSWKGDVRATAPLKSVSTGKCLDLSAFTKSTDARLWDCKDASSQKFLIKPSGHKGTDSPLYPDKAEFDKAKKVVTDSQAAAKKNLAALKTQLENAKKAATVSDAAEQAAYGIADAAGAPRGRGLLVGQQKAQVTKGSVAALTAMVKASETAEAATRAAAGDSATITQRALAQAAQVNAEFRKEAAHTAELQAKAAADAAKLHRDNAKKDKETAEAKLAVALKAEGDAKAAAADARAERLAAEAEEKTAKAEKDTAAAKQAEANQHKQTAQAEAANAKDAKEKAEAAEATAVARKNDAVKSRDKARDLRDDAWDAEQKADAARAKADAKEAFAQAHESDSNAQESRAAADAASAHADDAEAAAGRARTAADAATQAAAEADAAATRAEAAAKRARSHADAAQAAKLKADAAVKTATSAVADAIEASQHASLEAKAAVKLADEAEKLAKTAKSQADEAKKEAAKALAASAKAAGFAYVTAQAAADAGNAAAQVAKPANDAIQLGSPYVDTDSAAGLVVLTGQAAKSIADQQKAVADAHAKNAQAEAAAAKNLAEQAQGDVKIAYQHAANAATHAATARTYSKEALGYAADAAAAASKASASLARTIEYDRQATADASAADQAAGRAEGYARDARASADQAALDAQAARDAAAAAEQSAKDARAAADRADAAATEAEQAAKDALKYAEEAQKAAEEAARNAANKQVSTGAGTGVGGTWYVVDEDSIEITDAKQHEPCVIDIGFEGCTTTFTVTFSAVVDFFLCTNPDTTASADGCPSADTLLIESKRIPGLKKDVTRYFSKLELIQQTLTYKLIKAVLVQDFVDCWHGSASGCAWALSNFIPGKALGTVFDGIRALDAAMKTGAGVRDALHALKALDLDPGTLAKLNAIINAHEDLYTACKVNSFPGTTKVLMADGSHRPISQVGVGDLVKATDPVSGKLRARQVTDTFKHDTQRLVDIAVADGGRLASTAGHKFYVVDRGWTLVSDLRVGDRLRTPDGSVRAVTALDDRSGLAPRMVYDLTVDDLHTFFVLAGAAPVLVHNCKVALGWQRNGKLDEWAQLPENKFHTFSNVAPRDFARIAEMAIADPSVTLHINMTGLAEQGTFIDAAQRGLKGGEGGAAATDYEMSMIARALANGQRPWSSIKFYSPSGPGGAMRLDPPTPMPDLSVLKGDLDPVKGSVIGYCHC
ncbi:RICIN domain-containing protein [Streptomyces sp. NL15-2K]|uniref:RICIN domain-containing protein n=1 Tax=Streptomyces sp. NL15-2K TaxID=376149 RepID=UPI000FFAFBA7|nr:MULTISPECIES: ricin-type beta-trefoil lectin domain protein [Actinomycetes]WKX13470.1 ricin-type beta-trefoil lectin domain protein [Kutzneria buriramensis]GCB45150.1 secreted protein [Streptomyces sp. NL15-2K]